MGGGQVKGVLFGLLWWASIWVHQPPENPNAASRLDLLHALASHGTFRIDAYHPNTTNKALWQGHYYSDKPPGLVVIALPVFLLLRNLLGPSLESEPGWLASSWLACACASGLLFALGGVACFSWLKRWTNPRAALLATLGLTLGTPLFPYATSWFPHAATAGLLWLGFNCTAHSPHRGTSRRALLAGLCCGMACAMEYSAALPALAMFAAALTNRRQAVWLALGWLPPVALVGCYHWLCFGSPLTLSYQHTAELVHMRQGFCGIRFPPPAENLSHLLLSPERGLLLWAPALLLLPIGWRILHLRKRQFFYFSYASALVQWILIGGYADVAAGCTLGPRLLLCLLPWLAVPTALALERHPRLGLVLVGWGCAINWVAAWHGLELPPDVIGETFAQRIMTSPVHALGEPLGMPRSLSAAVHLLGAGAAIRWLLINPASRRPDKEAKDRPAQTHGKHS